MKGLKVFLGVVTLALVVSLSLGAECTPTTCHDGPVVAQFWTSDCSDEPTYFEVLLSECNSNNSPFLQMVGDSIIQTNFIAPNPTCNHSLVNATYKVYVNKIGACVRTSTSASRMHLRNVNDSYISPQPFQYDSTVPMYPPVTFSCSGVDDCQDSKGDPALSWTTYHDGTGSFCPAALSSSIRFTQLGVCTNYQNYTYYKTGCIDQFGDWEALCSDANCSDPIDLTITRTLCGSTSSVLHCIDTPTSIPDIFPFDVYPPATPGDASSPSAEPSDSGFPNSVASSSPTSSAPTSSASSIQNAPLIISLSFVVLMAFGSSFI